MAFRILKYVYLSKGEDGGKTGLTCVLGSSAVVGTCEAIVGSLNHLAMTCPRVRGSLDHDPAGPGEDVALHGPGRHPLPVHRHA